MICEYSDTCKAYWIEDSNCKGESSGCGIYYARRELEKFNLPLRPPIRKVLTEELEISEVGR